MITERNVEIEFIDIIGGEYICIRAWPQVPRVNEFVTLTREDNKVERTYRVHKVTWYDVEGCSMLGARVVLHRRLI